MILLCYQWVHSHPQLKRMKQMEQEKEVLLEGLHAVERARDWYLKQVAAVSEKMKYLGRMGSHMVCKQKPLHVFSNFM